ncbi:MAG: GNAT family N-acetyltransferase [Haloarculaceae archaeon]
MGEVTVRRAEPADQDAVAAFTADTWAERDVSDYIPEVFSEWVAEAGADRRTVVATVGEEPIGVCSGTILTDGEAWMQGIRVDPDHRRSGVGQAMTDDLFDWARERGASVARNMVFGWNDAALGTARIHGFEPATTGRWARPEPDGGADPTLPMREEAAAAWSHWTDSDARAWLAGLALDGEEAWALAELRRDRFLDLADKGRVIAVVDGTTRAMTVTAGRREGTDDDGDSVTVADYAVASWDDLAAARSLFEAIRADAAARDVDGTRVLVPETPAFVTDAASTRAPLSDRPFYVMAADLTDRS